MNDLILKEWNWFDLDDTRFDEMAKARKVTFIDRFGWDIPTYKGGDLEIDQFDNEKARYITYEKPDGIIYGSARILPHKCSMTKQIWPQLYGVVDETFYEVSRLTLHGKTDRKLTKAASVLMREYMSGGNYYGCADKYILRVYPVMFGLTPIQVHPDPNGDPEINIAVLSNGGANA